MRKQRGHGRTPKPQGHVMAHGVAAAHETAVLDADRAWFAAHQDAAGRVRSLVRGEVHYPPVDGPAGTQARWRALRDHPEAWAVLVVQRETVGLFDPGFRMPADLSGDATSEGTYGMLVDVRPQHGGGERAEQVRVIIRRDALAAELPRWLAALGVAKRANGRVVLLAKELQALITGPEWGGAGWDTLDDEESQNGNPVHSWHFPRQE